MAGKKIKTRIFMEAALSDIRSEAEGLKPNLCNDFNRGYFAALNKAACVVSAWLEKVR